MSNILATLDSDDKAAEADYKRFYDQVLGKDSGANSRFTSLFKSHWQPYISKLQLFPAYRDEFKTRCWDAFRACRLREVGYNNIILH